jgi:cell shape-determining protein MreD
LIYGKGRGKEKARIDWHGFVGRLVAPLKIVITTAAFILSLDRLGYLATSTFYMFILLFWVSRYRVWVAMGLAIILGVGSWYFFAKILEVQLPRGLWIPQ